MLKNWPRPGSQVKFVKDVPLTDGTTVRVGTMATLGDYGLKKASESSGDEFVVTLPDGRRVTGITRDNIE